MSSTATAPQYERATGASPLRLVNTNPKYARVKLIAPSTLGYIYIAATVEPGPLPMVLPSRRRARLVRKLRPLVAALGRVNDVVKATMFRAKIVLDLWEYLADWYVKETGLRNSVALAPVAGVSSEYAVINWARWDERPARHFLRQLSKRSFWRHVTTNLDVNHAASMPIYCRRV